MRVLVAPNAFKESLTAREAARAIGAGVRRACPSARVALCPVADGGDGTRDVLGLPVRRAWARDPLGRRIRARFGYDARRRLAVVELAEASGLARVAPRERDPLRASTEGTGDLLRAALDAGAREVIVGVGGSATVDAGTGIARALGARFLDARGRDLAPGGGALTRLARIDLSGLDPRVRRTRLRVACDVRNPLLGPRGAAPVFAPQKGASHAAVRRLARGLGAFARLAGRGVGRLPRGGAAGGAAAGMAALLGASLEDGAEAVLAAIGCDRRLRGADLVITGEGRFDGTTSEGKAPSAVARHAARAGVPVVALCGERVVSARRSGFAAVLSIAPGPSTREASVARAAAWLAEAAESAVSVFLAGRRRWTSR